MIAVEKSFTTAKYYWQQASLTNRNIIVLGMWDLSANIISINAINYKYFSHLFWGQHCGQCISTRLQFEILVGSAILTQDVQVLVRLCYYSNMHVNANIQHLLFFRILLYPCSIQIFLSKTLKKIYEAHPNV